MELEMGKRTNTVSSRIPGDLEDAARAIAAAKDMSLSELINMLLSECVDRERSYAQKISAALGVNEGLHGKHG